MVGRENIVGCFWEILLKPGRMKGATFGEMLRWTRKIKGAAFEEMLRRARRKRCYFRRHAEVSKDVQ